MVQRHADDGAIRELGNLNIKAPCLSVANERVQGNCDFISCFFEFRQFKNEASHPRQVILCSSPDHTRRWVIEFRHDAKVPGRLLLTTIQSYLSHIKPSMQSLIE